MAAGDASSTFTIEVEVDASNAQASAASFFSTLRGATSGLDSEINKLEKATAGAGAAQQKLGQNLSTTRYALYDVASTLTTTGVALLGVSVASSAVAIAWERDFAQVVRTTGVVGDRVGELRSELVELAQTMPAAFGDITAIATLAGQLGVAEDRVASFTDTTTKFSTVTDLTVEAAATAFGRLDALLPDVQGNYEALGSSIALVGVNSVATESQITNISTQISSMGAFAGLTADEVIGLSGALASVGAAPELSRGTVTRLFTQMSKAIAEGGDSLDNFARVAGVSSAEFESAFGTAKFGPIFQSFIQGLDDTTRTGGNAVATLESLGITSVRDVPLLLRLAGANDVVTRSFADAKQGFEEGSELNRQYGIIAETTAAKLQILANNFMALLDALGGATTGPIGIIADHFSDILSVVTDLVSTPVGQWVAGAVVAFGAILGVLLLLGGALTVGYAGIIGMQQALMGLTGATTVSSVGLRGLTAQLLAVGGAGTVAARGLQGVSLAMKGLLAGLVVFAGFEIASFLTKGIGDINFALKGLEQDADSAFNRMITGGKTAASYFAGGDFLGSLNRAFAPIATSTTLRDIATVDEALRDMVNNGHADEAREKLDALRESWVQGGGDVSSFKVAYADANAALREYTIAQNAANYETARGREEVNLMAAEQEVAEQRTADLAAAIGLTVEQLGSMQENIATGSQGFFDWAGNVRAAYEEGGGGITQFIETLDSQLVAQQQWASDLTILTAMGATGFASELAKMGPAGAALAADAVKLSADELMKLEGQARLAAFLASDAFASEFTAQTPLMMEAYRAGGVEAVQALIDAQVSEAPGAVEAVISQYNLQLAGKPMNIQAEASAADRELQRFVNRVNSSTATVTVYARTADGESRVIRDPSTYRYATGGPVFGPGTGTSDSIPAYLSNGEYVIRAAAVQKYGTSFLNAINSARVPKFASGGPVSGGAVSGGAGLASVVELGPKSLARISQQAAINIMFDEVGLSRAVERGDRARRAMGD